jgi:hypothetical protein
MNECVQGEQRYSHSLELASALSGWEWSALGTGRFAFGFLPAGGCVDPTYVPVRVGVSEYHPHRFCHNYLYVVLDYCGRRRKKLFKVHSSGKLGKWA